MTHPFQRSWKTTPVIGRISYWFFQVNQKTVKRLAHHVTALVLILNVNAGFKPHGLDPVFFQIIRFLFGIKDEFYTGLLMSMHNGNTIPAGGGK